MNRACWVVGALALAGVTRPGAAWCQSVRVRLGQHSRLTRLSAVQTAGSVAVPGPVVRSRPRVVTAGAAVLARATGGSLFETVKVRLLRWRPAVTKRLGFSISRGSLLTRFSDWLSIERVSPRLWDASRTFRFTLRYVY